MKNVRCPANLTDEPVHHARERKAQELLEEVRQALAKSVKVDNARLTSYERLLAYGRSHAQEDPRVGGAIESGEGLAPSELVEKEEGSLHQIVRDALAEETFYPAVYC